MKADYLLFTILQPFLTVVFYIGIRVIWWRHEMHIEAKREAKYLEWRSKQKTYLSYHPSGIINDFKSSNVAS